MINGCIYGQESQMYFSVSQIVRKRPILKHVFIPTLWSSAGLKNGAFLTTFNHVWLSCVLYTVCTNTNCIYHFENIHMYLSLICRGENMLCFTSAILSVYLDGGHFTLLYYWAIWRIQKQYRKMYFKWYSHATCNSIDVNQKLVCLSTLACVWMRPYIWGLR